MTYNIVKSKFYFLKTLVCFLLWVTLLSLIATSCRQKDKGAALLGVASININNDNVWRSLRLRHGGSQSPD